MWHLLKDTLGVLGPILVIVATYGYIKAIKEGLVRPHRATWAIWAIATTAGWIATLLAHSGLLSLVIPTIYTLIEYWVVWLTWTGYEFRYKNGSWARQWEKILLPAAIAAGAGWYLLVHWNVIGLATGITIAIVADFMASAFTLHKEVEDPASEDWKPWALSSFGAFLGVLALRDYSYTAAGFTIYLAAMTGVIALWVYLSQQRAARNKSRGQA